MRSITMPYVEPRVEILEAVQDSEISRVVVRFDRLDSGPIAPAGLYLDPRSRAERFQLHKEVGRDGLVFTFETYDSTHPLPLPGEVYAYRGWWNHEAMDAVLDRSAEWTRQKYPDNGDHDHCLLTWATISAGSENAEGYCSRHGWITVEAYDKFIRGDVYRLRRNDANDA